MPAILDARVLQTESDLPDPRDVVDRIQNEISAYYVRNGVGPKYLYINERTWVMCMAQLLPWTDGFGVEVIANKFQHPRVHFVKGKRYPYREIAAESARLMKDEEESIMRGLLEIL